MVTVNKRLMFLNINIKKLDVVLDIYAIKFSGPVAPSGKVV